MDDRPRLRLFVDQPLAPGARLELSAAQAHRLRAVMRLRAGDAIALFNGVDGEWAAELEEAGKRGAAALVRDRRRAQADEPDLWLLFAPVKRLRIDMIAEKATELGASSLVPVLTRRTVAERVNEDRLRAIAIEAAEQCGRLTVPRVAPARPLAAVLTEWPAGRRLIVLDESGGGAPIAQALRPLEPGPAAILVGPEGGFADSELDALRSLSFAVAVGMGPRTLRAETAALAALACYQALCGDGDRPPRR